MSNAVKKRCQRFIIFLFGFIIFFSHEKSRLFAQPVGPIDLNTGSYQANDWNSLFEQAFHLSSVTSWDQLVNQQFVSFKADWETQANIEFTNILSTVTQTDGVVGNQAYIDYVTNYLNLEKEDAAKNWEALASARIQEERNYFLASLQGTQVDALGNTIPNPSNGSTSQALEEWNSNFQQNVQVGLYEFQTALTNLQTTFQSMWNSISSTDAEFAANLQQIEAFESQVRSTVQSNNNGLKAYLLQQSLLHNRNSAGVSLLGDFSTLTNAELLTAYNSIDETKLNAAGRRLKDLIDDLSAALDPTQPASLTDIADTMQDYLQEQQQYATTTAQGYRDVEYDLWSYGDGTLHNFSLNGFTTTTWNDPVAVLAKNYIDNPTTANYTALLAQLSGLLGNPNLVVSDVSNVDLVANSTSDYVNHYLAFNSDVGTPFLGLGGSYRSDGTGFWTFQGLYWAGWAGVFWSYTETYAENNVYFQGNVQVHDLAAQNNAQLYEGYRDELNGKFNLWQGTLLPAIQNWEQQVTDYKARYTEWQAKKVELQANLQTQYQSQSAELFQNRDSWLTELSNLNADANSVANNAPLPAFSTNVNTNSLTSISQQISQFQNTELPNANVINQFATNLQQAVNGAYNLSLIEANQIAALQSQKEALESLVQNLEKQREMKDEVPDDVLAKFTGKNSNGDDSNAPDAGMCMGSKYKSNQSACDAIQNDDRYFQNKYKNVYADSAGNIHVVYEEKSGVATLEDGKDATDFASYHLETKTSDRVIGNAGTVKLADTSKLGGIFNSNWLSESKEDEFVSYMNQSNANRTKDYLNDKFIDSISANMQNLDKVENQNSILAQKSAIAQVNFHKTASSLVQAMIGGTSGTAWAKQQIKDMTVSAVSKAISKAFPNISPDLVAAWLGNHENEKARKKAEQQMQTRTIITAGVIGAGFTVLGPLAITGTGLSAGALGTFAATGAASGIITASALTYVPGLKEIGKPLGTIMNNATSELLVGTTKLLTSSDLAYGAANLGLVSKDTLKHYNTEGIEAAEYVRGKDLKAILATGDLQAQYKAAIKDGMYLKVSEIVAAGSGGTIDPKLLSALWQEQDRRIAANKAEREQQQQMLSTAVSIAAAIAMQFVPGPGNVAGASLISQVGNYFSSVKGMIAIANATVQGAIASRHGNMNEVFAGVTNGLLLGATGPGGLAGYISYTPPQNINTLGGLIDRGMNGAQANGWGGGFALGSSALNGGISFAPGSGFNLNVGGKIFDTAGFYNLSYNLQSGHTSGSVGMGQEYGTNVGVSFSTDHSQPPGIFAGYGCDVNGTNCGGGKNALGAGGSITLTADGNITFGADVLGNQAASISYNVNTGSWSGVQVSNTWAQDFNYMNAQQVMDAKIKAQDALRSSKELDVASDLNIINKSEYLKGLASQMGLSPEKFAEAMTQLSSDLKNGKLDGPQLDAAIKLANDVMGLIHNEAYPDPTKATPNTALQDAIHDSPAVYGTANTSNTSNSVLNQFLGQANIYLNNLVGNAFGEFSYVDSNGNLVFQQCFVAGTLVHTKRGLVPIETIQVGDEVLSYNESGETTEYNRVLKTYIREAESIYRLTYENGRVIETTASHPFQIANKGWVEVKDLKVGDRSILSNDETLGITSITIEGRQETVYNLKVENAHTYYVTEDAILVHNANYNENAVLGVTEFMRRAATIDEATKKQVTELSYLEKTKAGFIDQIGALKNDPNSKELVENIKKTVDQLNKKIQDTRNYIVTTFTKAADASKNANGEYTGVFAVLNRDPVLKYATTSISTDSIKNVTKDVLTANQIERVKNYLLAGGDLLLPKNLTKAEVEAIAERTFANITFDPSWSVERKRAEVEKLTSVLFGAQSGNQGTAIQLTMIMQAIKESADFKKDSFKPAANLTPEQLKNFNEVRDWIFSPNRSESDAAAISAATCRIYANWMQGVAEGKTNVSFAEFYTYKVKTGDLALAGNPKAPVVDGGHTPGYMASYGNPVVTENDFGNISMNANGSLQGFSNPIPVDDLKSKLDSFAPGKVIQVWDDASGVAGPNHFCLWMKQEDGSWVNMNHTGGVSGGGTKYNEVISINNSVKVYKIYY
ncbi:TIGR04388 family protein [Leptospira stimsonii]|uniref:Toxin n=1 Tax=Leptospira stimsonii TaxID=2202203 RepID=A0A396YTG2_9LEPT|nr:TIGR04388 family protein [Leptospira stimsonii]RHX84748.1 toxin [Leptospira stimsonii]